MQEVLRRVSGTFTALMYVVVCSMLVWVVRAAPVNLEGAVLLSSFVLAAFLLEENASLVRFPHVCIPALF